MWDDPAPFVLVPLITVRDWRALESRYPGPRRRGDLPLGRCLQIARANGARCAVIETRYMDRDYRSEFSGFYSVTHAEVPSTAHRVHFFGRKLKRGQVAALPDDHSYIGFMVIRPIPSARVGRTMLPPPPGIAPYVRCAQPDTVHLFGQKLAVPPSVPFMQQDTQLGRCAHVAAWVCHHIAYLGGETGRRTLAELTSGGRPRQGPSPGLTVDELAEVLATNGLTPTEYPLDLMPAPALVPWETPQPVEHDAWGQRLHDGLWNREILRTACRYLNGGRPLIVANFDHAFVLVGYKRMHGAAGSSYIALIRHDDQRGPYLPVHDPFNDVDLTTGVQYGCWENLIAPLPERLWLPPEPVEADAGRRLQAFARYGVSSGLAPAAAKLDQLIAADDLALRVYAAPSNKFKREASRFPSPYASEVRLQGMPRYVWIAELVDRSVRDSDSAGSNDCVVGEAVYDATSSETDPTPLALHVPGLAILERHGRRRLLCPPRGYATGGVGPA